MRSNLYLIGFMGSGKSTIAKHLARKLSVKAIESDQMIEQEQGMTISDIFKDKGEKYFRDVETALMKKLSGEKGLVVSCGGGVVLRPENVSAMKDSGSIILLTASPQTVYSRVRRSTNRPILNGNMNIEYISRLMEKRQPLYTAAADLIISTDGKTPDAIAREIRESL